jgi:murein DD-endopeptidase MepM/ murein hydrolase activator NlpD
VKPDAAKISRRWKWLFLAAVAVSVGLYHGGRRALHNHLEGTEVGLYAAATPDPGPSRADYPFSVGKNSTIYEALRGVGFAPLDIQNMVAAAKPHYNLGRVLPGTKYQVHLDPGPAQVPIGITFKFSPTEYLELHRLEDGNWASNPIREPIQIQVKTFSGTVTSSLWESAETANMDPNLIAELSEIFAWQIDFAREVRQNDRWRLSVEQKLVRGENVGWGRILAAEYENAGELHTAILFRVDGRELGYFAPDGSSLRRMFLKSPIRFGRVTSRFQRNRFHPILKTGRPHLGVDYGAPAGTPIRAVGDGTVVFAGTRGGAGRTIKIRHNSIYQTAYLHLNGFASGIRSGARVRQGQLIGYVGSSGLSTGPHLHFEFYQAGRFVDPLGKKFPSADPVPQRHIASFQAETQNVMVTLPPWGDGGSGHLNQMNVAAPASAN